MNGKLLDTNAVIALQKSDSEILKLLDTDEELFLPAIVAGELYYGAYNSARKEANIKTIEEFVDANVVLDCDINTARIFGKIRHELRAKGRPIPENDIWIAALALQYNLTLTTRDSHFGYVDGLILQAW